MCPVLSLNQRAQYTVLVPALWNTEVQDWELKCMNSLELDESHNEPKAGTHALTTRTSFVRQKLTKQRDSLGHSANSLSNSGNSVIT